MTSHPSYKSGHVNHEHAQRVGGGQGKASFKSDRGQAAHKPKDKSYPSKVAPGLNKSFGVTTEKIKIKRNPRQSISSAKSTPYVNPEYVQDNFAKKYGFRKQPTGRSPLSAFEHAHYIGHYGQLSPSSLMHPQERAMVHKEPSGFKCHSVGGTSSNVGSRQMGGARGGALRLSGHHGAHQVGKRSAKRGR